MVQADLISAVSVQNQSDPRACHSAPNVLTFTKLLRNTVGTRPIIYNVIEC